MQNSVKSVVAYACLGAAILVSAACAPRHIPMSADDLMEDRVTLDGVLMKCDANKAMARTDEECINARIAIDRLASKKDQAKEAKRAEDFERNRELLRLSQERQRKEQEEKNPKVDAYHLPLVPVEPAPASPPPPATTNGTTPPAAGDSTS